MRFTSLSRGKMSVEICYITHAQIFLNFKFEMCCNYQFHFCQMVLFDCHKHHVLRSSPKFSFLLPGSLLWPGFEWAL